MIQFELDINVYASDGSVIQNIYIQIKTTSGENKSKPEGGEWRFLDV